MAKNKMFNIGGRPVPIFGKGPNAFGLKSKSSKVFSLKSKISKSNNAFGLKNTRPFGLKLGNTKGKSFNFNSRPPQVKFGIFKHNKISLNTKPISIKGKKIFQIGASKGSIFQIGSPMKRPMKDKDLNWTQASTRYRKLTPFADKDRDGIQNWLDCRPLNAKMKGPLHTPPKSSKKKAFELNLLKKQVRKWTDDYDKYDTEAHYDPSLTLDENKTEMFEDLKTRNLIDPLAEIPTSSRITEKSIGIIEDISGAPIDIEELRKPKPSDTGPILDPYTEPTLKDEYYDPSGKRIKKVKLSKGQRARPITSRSKGASILRKATMQGKFPFEVEKKGIYILKDEKDWKTLPKQKPKKDTDTAMITAPAVLGGKDPLPPQVPETDEEWAKKVTGKTTFKEKGGGYTEKTITGVIEGKAAKAKIIKPKHLPQKVRETDITITADKIKIIKVDDEVNGGVKTPGQYKFRPGENVIDADFKTISTRSKSTKGKGAQYALAKKYGKKFARKWKKASKRAGIQQRKAGRALTRAEKKLHKLSPLASETRKAKKFRKLGAPAMAVRPLEVERSRKRVALGTLGLLGLISPEEERSLMPRKKGIRRKTTSGRRGRPTGTYKNVIPGKGPVHIYQYRKWLRRQRALKRLQREPEYEDFEGERIQTQTEEEFTPEPQGEIAQEKFTEDRGGYEAIREDRGEMRAGETIQRGKSSILSASNVFNPQERARLPPMKDPVQNVDTVHKPVVNPEGDYYTDIDPLSGKPILQRRVRERWAEGG